MAPRFLSPDPPAWHLLCDDCDVIRLSVLGLYTSVRGGHLAEVSISLRLARRPPPAE